MKAVIMAGGEGSRLRPLTIRRPKPMVPVVDRPAIVHIMELLKKHGITEVVITLQYLSAATIVLKRMPNPLEYGVVIIDDQGRVRQFQEKPSWGEVFSDTVNTGIYILEPKIFDYYEPDQVFDFSNNLFPILLEKGDPMYGYVADGYWCDVGSITDYMRATGDYLRGEVNVPRLGTETAPG